MSFANHNILDIALSLIPPTVVQIRKNLGTVVNKYGQSEASYTEWIEVYGIVQPGSEQNEHTQGVDFSKKHVTIWLRGIALDGTHIQWAPDQIRYVGGIYNVVSVKDWYPYDNYRECDCVEAMNLGADQRTSRQQQVGNPAPKKNETPSPLRKPVIFTADSIVREALAKSAKEQQPPQTPSLVGKAKIRF